MSRRKSANSGRSLAEPGRIQASNTADLRRFLCGGGAGWFGFRLALIIFLDAQLARTGTELEGREVSDLFFLAEDNHRFLASGDTIDDVGEHGVSP